FAPHLAKSLDGVADVAFIRHAGRQHGLQPGSRHGADQRQASEIIGPVLEKGRAQFDAFGDARVAGRRGGKIDAAFPAMLGGGGKLVADEFVPLEHVVLRLDHIALRAIITPSQIAVRDEILGAVILKLHRIGTRLGRSVDKPARKIDVAIVIDADFGDHVATSGPDGSLRHRTSSSSAFATRAAPRPSIKARPAAAMAARVSRSLARAAAAFAIISGDRSSALPSGRAAPAAVKASTTVPRLCTASRLGTPK